MLPLKRAGQDPVMPPVGKLKVALWNARSEKWLRGSIFLSNSASWVDLVETGSSARSVEAVCGSCPKRLRIHPEFCPKKVRMSPKNAFAREFTIKSRPRAAADAQVVGVAWVAVPENEFDTNCRCRKSAV